MNINRTNRTTLKKLKNIKVFTSTTALFLGFLVSGMQPVFAEGSRNLYPASSPANASRANLEWRNELIGNLIRRRTLLKVHANAGEYILLGSTAVGIGGDIYVYNPGIVTGSVGSETVPSTPTFKCTSQTGRGTITSRTQELAGPQNITGTGNTNGYIPCYYQAPSTGIYEVVIYGPAGFTVTGDGTVAADVNLTDSRNFATNQGSSVAAWDVTVRSSTSSTTDLTGRLFSYYLALFTGANGRPVYSTVYPVTTDGYRYKTEIRGLDPNGFLIYGNEVGFFDSDGTSTLYRDIVGADGQITNPQGGTQLARPQFPTFFNQPDPTTLGFINRYDRTANLQGVGITTNPIAPVVSNPNFSGNLSGNNSKVGNGGTFSFNSTAIGSYEIVIKGSNSTDFDPTNPKNRVLRGYMNSAGTQSVAWDGKDNGGNFFPVGTNYQFKVRIRAGEYHFPILDAENNFSGGPTITLLNPPNTYPADLPGFGATTGFYDDRVYKTKSGAIVHTGATQTDINNNAPLCGINPPTIRFSDQITGFDTSTNQRAFGQSGSAGNTNAPCTGSFGDTKGLDQWTFFPSSAVNNLLNIVSPDLTITKTHTPTDFVKGSTGIYIISVPNSGGDATNGTQVSVTDTLPTGIIPISASGNGWNCTISGQTVTCTRSDVLAPGNTYPNININVTISSTIATSTVTNTATVSGGGDTNNSNNTSPPDVANVITAPDLTITKTHTGNFNQGDTGRNYTLTVSNIIGAGATNGSTVTVTDTIPTGLTPTAATGIGWNCNISGQTVSCTRSDVLNAGASYPAITLSVNVANNAPSTITNTGTVSGGGDITPGNNAATDQVNVAANNTPKLILVKRITRINSQDLTDIVDGRSDVPTTASNYVPVPKDVDDNDSKWPSNYLRGLINAGVVKPGDELEYTIYFLSNGLGNANKVQVCDLVPSNVTFITNAFNGLTPNDGGLPGADQGIALAVGSITPTVYFSNVADSDRATFYSANDTNTPSVCSASNTNGAVVVNITNTSTLPSLPPATGSGTPANSYGFVRFRGKVK